MSVIGIDPSLTATGVAIFHDDWSWSTYTIKTSADMKGRLPYIYNTLYDIVEENGPFENAFIESLPANARSAGLTGQAQGIIRLVLQANKINYCEFAPASVKLNFAGAGRAGKSAMIAKCKELNISVKNDNEADAVAVAYMGLNMKDITPPKTGWKWNK